MRITWFGHACFRLSGRTAAVVTDPYDLSIGIAPAEELAADVVTVSHGHYDHANVALVRGIPAVVRGAGTFAVAGVHIEGVGTYHDEAGGAKRGENVVYVIEIDGVRVCHLGDLGHPLSSDQVAALGRVDVLLVPVGGTYTLDGRAAADTVRAVRPAYAVPMHYRVRGLTIAIDGVEPFLAAVGEPHAGTAAHLDVRLPLEGKATQVVVLEPHVRA